MPKRFFASAALFAAGFLSFAVPRLSADPPKGQMSGQQNVGVSLEVRILTVAEDFLFERIGVEFRNGTVAKNVEFQEEKKWFQTVIEQPGKPLFLDDRQAMQLLETVCGDTRTRAPAAPKIIVSDGQAVVAAATSHDECCMQIVLGNVCIHTPNMTPLEIGKLFSAKPIVSADRHSIQVDLAIDKTEVAGPIEQKPILIACPGDVEKSLQQIMQCPTINKQGVQVSVVIPDGRTALIGGWKEISEVRCETAVPLLSKIPYLNRLFKNIGYEQEVHQVFVLVTARIVTYEAAEQVELGAFPHGEKAENACSGCYGPEAEPAPRPTKVIAELLKAYDKACLEGRADEAKKFAKAALLLDPTCFRRK